MEESSKVEGTLSLEPEEKNIADNERLLRSGSTHQRVSNNHNPEQPFPSLTASMTTNTVKLIPTTASVRAFSGSDADYSAREFIRLCEDVMTNSYVTENADKIAFIRSRLQPGSHACSLMQASAFTDLKSVKTTPNFGRTFLKCSVRLSKKAW